MRLAKPSRTVRSELKRITRQQRRTYSASAFAESGQQIIDPEQSLLTGSINLTGGASLIVDGGDVIFLDDNLVELFRVGTMEHGDRGLAIRRDDGSIALEMRKAFGPGDTQQVMLMRDRAGSVIGGDSLLSFAGIDVPHLPMQFIPVDYTSAATAQTTSSTVLTALHECRTFKQNPALKPQLMVKCSDATTAAVIQFYEVGSASYLGGFLGSPGVQSITIPAGTTTFTQFELPSGAVIIPGSMSAPVHLQIHARVTAGVGSVSVAPVRTVGSGI